MRTSTQGQVIHTSLRPVTSSKSDFPNSDPVIGVIARAVYHRSNQRIMVELYHESPIIISPGKGEFIESDHDLIDSKVRSLLIEIAERCRTQGEELLLHADRLLEIASQEELIDEINESKINANSAIPIGSREADFNSSINVTGETKNRGREKSGTGTGRVGKPAKDKGEDLLSMLEELEEEETEELEGAEEGIEEETSHGPASVSDLDLLELLEES
jgi:hypothetical protein